MPGPAAVCWYLNKGLLRMHNTNLKLDNAHFRNVPLVLTYYEKPEKVNCN